MPVRIVSLLPSATEVVAAAGGEGWLVGRSHECDCPKDIERLPVLTSATNEFQSSAQMNDAVAMSLERGDGLYALESNLLQRLRPDVIVTQDLCAVGCSYDQSACYALAEQILTKRKSDIGRSVLWTSKQCSAVLHKQR